MSDTPLIVEDKSTPEEDLSWVKDGNVWPDNEHCPIRDAPFRLVIDDRRPGGHRYAYASYASMTFDQVKNFVADNNKVFGNNVDVTHPDVEVFVDERVETTGPYFDHTTRQEKSGPRVEYRFVCGWKGGEPVALFDFDWWAHSVVPLTFAGVNRAANEQKSPVSPSPMKIVPGLGRQSAGDTARDRARRLREEADRLEAIAAHADAHMKTGSPEEQALWELIARQNGRE